MDTMSKWHEQHYSEHILYKFNRTKYLSYSKLVTYSNKSYVLYDISLVLLQVVQILDFIFQIPK